MKIATMSLHSSSHGRALRAFLVSNPARRTHTVGGDTVRELLASAEVHEFLEGEVHASETKQAYQPAPDRSSLPLLMSIDVYLMASGLKARVNGKGPRKGSSLTVRAGSVEELMEDLVRAINEVQRVAAFMAVNKQEKAK